MQLGEIRDLGELLQGDPGVTFTRVVYDSRRAEAGSLFVAVPGFRYDGHDFIEEAAARGAVAVMVERPVSVRLNLALLQVPESRPALAALACRFHRWPSRRLRVIGVTGTNGKTTTTHLIRAILAERHFRVGLLGTVHNYIGDEILPPTHTTPEAPDLQAYLSRMTECGSHYAVMEVSSHALDLHRVDGVEFDLAVFTNLTQDHLDFHGDLDRYRSAKGLLFAGLGGHNHKSGAKAAVLNADDPATAYYRSLCRVPVLTYGIEQPADVSARDVQITPAGTSFSLVTSQGEATLRLRLAGRFNVYNSLAAAAVGLAEGIDLDTIVRALGRTGGVAGRLEAVEAGQPFGVFVDYAHTPDGLANVLRAARALTPGRVIVVFGAGGDRDRSKRPHMGAVAAALSDLALITSDNPRSEDPAAIVREIEVGFVQAGAARERYAVVLDRAQAIGRAIGLAGPGDVVLIAGKGHETYQIFADRTIPFDDREVARRAITGHPGGAHSPGAS